VAAALPGSDIPEVDGMSEPGEWSDIAPHLHGVASLATVTPSGGPHVSIVMPAHVDGTIWVGSHRSARKAINVAAHGKVALV
jgi:general stress protein 26